jgi:hypothetical protein
MNKFSFVDRMKKETWDEHEASKDSNFAKGIMSGEFGQQGFVEWQRALYPIYVTLENILKKNRGTTKTNGISLHQIYGGHERGTSYC